MRAACRHGFSENALFFCQLFLSVHCCAPLRCSLAPCLRVAGSMLGQRKALALARRHAARITSTRPLPPTPQHQQQPCNLQRSVAHLLRIPRSPWTPGAPGIRGLCRSRVPPVLVCPVRSCFAGLGCSPRHLGASAGGRIRLLHAYHSLRMGFQADRSNILPRGKLCWVDAKAAPALCVGCPASLTGWIRRDPAAPLAVLLSPGGSRGTLLLPLRC